MKERQQRRVSLVGAPEAVVERKQVKRVAFFRVAAIVGPPNVEPRTLGFVVALIVKERRGEIIRPGFVLPWEVKGKGPEIDFRRRARIARIAAAPRTESRPH